MKRTHTSYSEAALYNRCAYAHHLKYKRGLRRIQEADHLRLGSLVDKGLQAALLTHNRGPGSSGLIEYASNAAIADEITRYLEKDHIIDWANSTPEDGGPTIRQLSIGLGNKACVVAIRTIRYLGLGTDKWKTVKLLDRPAIQTELRDKIFDSDKEMLGYLDWVATNREGETFLIDFKVRKKRSNHDAYFDMLEDDWQLPLYVYALRQKGYNIQGVAHLNIYGQVPKEPKVNKNGSISRSACDTDWETYANAVMRARLDPNNYLTMKEKLEDKEWITWTQRYISSDEAEFAALQLRRTNNKIEQSTAATATRNIFPMTCKMCDVNNYCRINRQGGNADNLIGTEYYIKGEEAALVNIQRLPVVEGDRHEADER